MDDAHKGHDSVIIEHFLKQLSRGCHRVRIQGRCTKFIQPADTTFDNKQLNAFLCDKMRALKISEKETTGKPVYFTSLTVAGRKYLGKFLADVKREWETDKLAEHRKRGIKKSFEKTVLQLNTKINGHSKFQTKNNGNCTRS